MLETAPRVAHLRLLEATVPQCGPDAVVSHTSAAVLHELPVWREHLSRVHLTRDRHGGGRARRWVQVHGMPLPASDVVELGGSGSPVWHAPWWTWVASSR